MIDYEVRLYASTEHVYQISARSPEEAETIATERLLEDNEPGVIENAHVELSEAIPLEANEEGE
jgi:hypothetical protein